VTQAGRGRQFRSVKAAGRRGRILLSEVCLTEHIRHTDTAMALWLEVTTANSDRSVADLSALAGSAGLTVARVDTASTRVMLELHR
jgi:hypothetical protein